MYYCTLFAIRLAKERSENDSLPGIIRAGSMGIISALNPFSGWIQLGTPVEKWRKDNRSEEIVSFFGAIVFKKERAIDRLGA